MIHRPFAVLLAVWLMVASVLFPYREVRAALPALLVVEEALSFAGGLVLRQAGKEAIVSLGVAANDASWAPAITSLTPGLAAMLGISLAVGGADRYVLPVTPSVEIQPDTVSPANGAPGSYSNPLLYTSPMLRFTSASNFCYVGGDVSKDGLGHSMPTMESQSLDAIAAACNSFRANVARIVWRQPASVGLWDDEPIETMFNGVTYYVKSHALCQGAPVNPDPSANDCQPPPNYHSFTMVEPADGQKRFTICGSGFCPDAADPDWTDAEKALYTGGKQLVFKGADAAGHAVRVDAAYDAVKGLTVQEITQVAPSQVQFRQLSLSPQASVKSVTGEIVNDASVDTFYEKNPSLQPNAVPDPAAGSVQFPNDYARQGEAAAAASSLTPKLDQLHTDLTKIEALPADPALPTSSQFEDSFFKGVFDALKAWRLPAHSSACPTSSFQALGSTYSFSAHCDLINGHWNELSSVMTVVWSLLALWIVLRA